jgi:hypothetical protein
MITGGFNNLKHEVHINAQYLRIQFLPKTKQLISITEIKWILLFRKIITAYSENHTKAINTFCEQNLELLNIKPGGTYSYHRVLKG